MDEGFVPAALVAERMGVSSDTVTRWCRQGRIPAIKPGRDWRVPASIAEDLISRAQDRAPTDPWRTDLENQLAGLSPSDHVLVLVPGGLQAARRFRDLLVDVCGEDTLSAVEPPPAPRGGLFARAALTAAGRAHAASEIEQDGDGDQPQRFIRWTSRIPAESLPTETRVTRAAAEHGWIVFCVLPLEGKPDLATLVQTHTHVLVGQEQGPSWLGSARGGSWLALTGS